jgi:hypothetical protein
MTATPTDGVGTARALRAHPLLLALGTLGQDEPPTLPTLPAPPAAPSLPTPFTVPPAPNNLGSVLTAAGIPNVTQSDVQNAIAGYTGLSVQSQTALLNAAQGVVSNGVSVGTLTPLLAAGFASVGLAPVAAVLAIGLPLIQTIASLLQPSPTCTWTIGVMCVNNPHGPPYGPTDTRWQTYPEWYAGMLQLIAEINQSHITPESVIAGLNSIKLPGDWPTPAAPQDVFLAVYQAAWRANCEFLINGHAWLDPYELLTTMQQVWNSTHAPGAGYTFTTSSPNAIGYLLNGTYSGDQFYSSGDHPPLTINTGSAVAPPAAAASSSSSASAGTVAAVAVGAAAVGVGIWAAVTGRLAHLFF